MSFTFNGSETFDLENTTASNVTGPGDDGTGLANSIFMSIVAILSIVGTVGNALLMVCVVKEPKLRTKANYLIVHFAAVNLSYSALRLSSQAIMYKVYVKIICLVMPGFGLPLFMMSLHSQLVISFNRYMLVTKSPEIYNKWFTFKKVGAVLSFFWLLDLILYWLIPAILINWKPFYLPSHSICLFAPDDYDLSEAMSPLTWSAFVLSLIFYIALIIYVRKNSSVVAQKRRDIKASMILLLIMTLYLITYNIMPSLISFINRQTSATYLTKTWINGFVKILQWLSVSVGSVCYSLNIKEFRMTYNKLVCPFKKVHPVALGTANELYKVIPKRRDHADIDHYRYAIPIHY